MRALLNSCMKCPHRDLDDADGENMWSYCIHHSIPKGFPFFGARALEESDGDHEPPEWCPLRDAEDGFSAERAAIARVDSPETDALDHELHSPCVLQDRYSEMRDHARKLERERDELQNKLNLSEKAFFAIDSLNASYVAAWKEVTDALGEREAGDQTSDIDRVLRAIREGNEALEKVARLQEIISQCLDCSGILSAAKEAAI